MGSSGAGVPVKRHRRHDEALHQVALGRTDIRLVDVDPVFAQALLQPQKMAVVAAVQPKHRTPAEVAQGQRAQFDTAFALQQAPRRRLLFDRDKGDRLRRRQAQPAWAVVGREPKLDLDAADPIVAVVAGIAPVARQQEALPRCVTHG